MLGSRLVSAAPRGVRAMSTAAGGRTAGSLFYNLVAKRNVTYITYVLTGSVVLGAVYGDATEAFWNAANKGVSGVCGPAPTSRQGHAHTPRRGRQESAAARRSEASGTAAGRQRLLVGGGPWPLGASRRRVRCRHQPETARLSARRGPLHGHRRRHLAPR